MLEKLLWLLTTEWLLLPELLTGATTGLLIWIVLEWGLESTAVDVNTDPLSKLGLLYTMSLAGLLVNGILMILESRDVLTNSACDALPDVPESVMPDLNTPCWDDWGKANPVILFPFAPGRWRETLPSVNWNRSCFGGSVVVFKTVLRPELINWRKPMSWLTGLDENTVFGRTIEVSIKELVEFVNELAADGDNIGSSSPSAANILRRFSSRLGTVSGMIVPGLEWELDNVKAAELAGGCIGLVTACADWRMPAVRARRRVDVSVEEPSTPVISFCFTAADCAVSIATISSSCSGTGVRA